MVDIVLMNQLLRAVSPWTCVVLVGDVGPTAVGGAGDGSRRRHPIQSGPSRAPDRDFPPGRAKLDCGAAHAVNAGELPRSAPASAGDFYVVEAETPELILDRLIQTVRERIPARFGLDPVRDVQVLSPMNRSELGVANLNAVLQSVLNPPAGKAEIEKFGWTFRVGDKVMQTENNYQREVFNGDLGRVAMIDERDRVLVVNFDGREVVYDFGELDEPGPGICDEHPQIAGLRVSGRGATAAYATLHDAPAQPPLYRHHSRQKARRAGRQPPSDRPGGAAARPRPALFVAESAAEGRRQSLGRTRFYGQIPRNSAAWATRSIANTIAAVRKSGGSGGFSRCNSPYFAKTASVARSIFDLSFAWTSARSHCSFSMFCTHSK